MGLLRICNATCISIVRVINAARKSEMNSETAIDALVGLGVPLALRSGFPHVDEVLRNDLQYGDVSEIAGESGAGKTQLCYALVANTLLETKFSIAWLDPNGSFRSQRLLDFIKRGIVGKDLDILSMLSRVQVARVSDQSQLLEALEIIDDNMERCGIRVVIIENVLQTFDDRQLGENSTKSSIITTILARINALCDIGCTVITTNTVFKEEEEKNERKAWVQHMKGRFLLRNCGGVRTLCSSNALRKAISPKR